MSAEFFKIVFTIGVASLLNDLKMNDAVRFSTSCSMNNSDFEIQTDKVTTDKNLEKMCDNCIFSIRPNNKNVKTPVQ